MSLSLVFDLEAVACPVAGPPRTPPEGDRLAPPAHWQIVAIGYVWLDGSSLTKQMGCRTGDERLILDDFLRGVAKAQPVLIGANTRGFDLPVIRARAFHHGLVFPSTHCGKDIWYRYSDRAHIDVQEVLSGYGAGHRSSVDALAKLAGWPGKIGIDGSNVEALVREERWDVLASYAQSDAVQETAIYLRTALTEGILSLEGYRRAAESLLAAASEDKRVAPLAAMVDRDRFLLKLEPDVGHQRLHVEE